jgi:hypothetical protein
LIVELGGFSRMKHRFPAQQSQRYRISGQQLHRTALHQQFGFPAGDGIDEKA